MVYPRVDSSCGPVGTVRLFAKRTAFWSGRETTEPVAVGALLLLGGIGGALAKVADESGVSWAGDLGTFAAVWVLALALISRFAPSPLHAALRSVAFFAAAVLTYYGWSQYVMGFVIDRNLWLWTGLALTAVPAIAVCAHWASKRRGMLPALVLTAVAALAVADGIVWQIWWAWGGSGAPDGFPLRPFQAVVNVAVALTVAGILPRYRATRLWALVFLVPAAIIVSRLVDFAMGNLYRLL